VSDGPGAEASEPGERTVWVTLYSQQVARVPVRAIPGTPESQLRDLALRALDTSGGAEWVSEAGWVEGVEWESVEQAGPAAVSPHPSA
jgi:hypothetical protein